MIGQLNQDNTSLYTLLKNIEQNLFDVKQVLQLKDRENKKLKGNHFVIVCELNSKYLDELNINSVEYKQKRNKSSPLQ